MVIYKIEIFIRWKSSEVVENQKFLSAAVYSIKQITESVDRLLTPKM